MANGEASSELSSADMGPSEIGSRSEHVRQVFENTSHYLRSRQVDIRFRIETVKIFAANLKWKRLLDIGCGNGAISLQLLTSTSHLTLLDISTSMADTARASIPEGYRENVEVRNENFSVASFEPKAFDLVVTVGVMAHVDSPSEFIAKIKSVLSPGGNVIIEFTDCRHPVGQLGRLWGQLKEVLAPAKYPTNRLSFSDVAPLFEKHNLRVVSVFRYARVTLPGIDRILSPETQYKMARFIFGQCMNNRNVWLGNEYILLLVAD